jgi:hypothetical protein
MWIKSDLIAMLPPGLLTLNRLIRMSKALCRYVAFLRAVKNVKLNSILKDRSDGNVSVRSGQSGSGFAGDFSPRRA